MASSPLKKEKTRKKVNKKKNTKKKGAFTLIELLAVIIILGVIMVIAIPSITKQVTESRKSSYVTTAKRIVDGAKTIVNSAELDVYDVNTTYYIPLKMIKTERGGDKSPFGEFEDAYVAVTYERNGYDYYWASSDSSKMGIYLSYIDKLDKKSVVSGVEGEPTDISICGKDHIVVFNEDGSVKEEKLAEDCIEPKGVYVKEDLSNCEYKLVTQYGSFSSSEDVKEICVKLVDNYTYEYDNSYYFNGMWSAGKNAVLGVDFDKTDFSPTSYVRVYNNNNKEVLLGEVTYADYPKYSRTIKSPTRDLISSVYKNLGPLPSSNAYYIEMSTDLAAKNDRSVHIYYANLTHRVETGPWLVREKDFIKIDTLRDSLNQIPLESVCSNPNPYGGVMFEGFSRNENTFVANIGVYCNGIPK